MPPNNTIVALHKSNRQKRLRIFKGMARVLLEIYYIQGPADLLALVVLLSRAYLDLAVITGDDLEKQLSYVRLADALRAKFELENDVDALQNSIRHYKQARGYAFNADAEAGLACALHHRYIALSNVDDCRVAIEILDEAWRLVLPEDSMGQSYVMTVLGLVRGHTSTMEALPTSCGNLSQILAKLRKTPGLTNPRSRFLLHLIAEARLLLLIAQLTHDLKDLQEQVALMELAASLCSGTAEVMWCQIIHLVLGHHHITLAFGEKHHSDHHMEQAMKLANDLRRHALSDRNVYMRSAAQYLWASFSMRYALRYQDLDLMELAVDVLRVTLLKCPQTLEMRRVLIADFSWMLGTYFSHSGRAAVLAQSTLVEHCSCRISCFPQALTTQPSCNGDHE
jgi:hypothetical protein